MKRILSAVLTATMIMTLFVACGKEQTQTTPKTENDQSQYTTEQTTAETTQEATEQTTEENIEVGYHTLYFKDSSKSTKAVATFFNSNSGKSEDVEMKKVSDDKDSVTFSCEGDCSVYNMAHVTYDDKHTTDFAFNQCTSGWYKTENDFLPYTEGEKTSTSPTFDDVTLTFKDYDKTVHIWKPDDYDTASQEKYSTLYVLDGQILSAFVVDHVKAMTSVTNKKTIVVAVDNVFARDYELVPKIGISADEKAFGSGNAPEYDGLSGLEFADFITNMLVPYIQQHYNVYTDARHTSITGASLSGLESFYIVMEHPDIFGTLGALSPSFWEYDDATWQKYLKDKSFSDNAPFLYFYTGPAQLDTDPHVTDMYNRLKKMNYPENRLLLHFNEKGSHNGLYWCCIFPEFLTAMFFQRVQPLQQ